MLIPGFAYGGSLAVTMTAATFFTVILRESTAMPKKLKL
jgi:hypothetical protein